MTSAGTKKWNWLNGLLVLACLAGCQSKGNKAVKHTTQEIQGVWVIDLDGLKKTPDFKAMPEEQQKVMMEVTKTMADTMVFTITENEFRIRAGKKEEITSYTVKSRKGNEWTLTSTGKSGVQEENKVRLEGDTLYLLGGGTEFTLKRQKKAST